MLSFHPSTRRLQNFSSTHMRVYGICSIPRLLFFHGQQSESPNGFVTLCKLITQKYTMKKKKKRAGLLFCRIEYMFQIFCFGACPGRGGQMDKSF